MNFVYIGMTLGTIVGLVFSLAYLPPQMHTFGYIALFIFLGLCMGIGLGFVSSAIYSSFCNQKINESKNERIDLKSLHGKNQYFLYKDIESLALQKSIDRFYMGNAIMPPYEPFHNARTIEQIVYKYLKPNETRYGKNKIVESKIINPIHHTENQKAYLIKKYYETENPWILEVFALSPIYEIHIPPNSILENKRKFN